MRARRAPKSLQRVGARQILERESSAPFPRVIASTSPLVYMIKDMSFGGTLYQLALALLIGIVWAFRSDHAHSEAAAVGAKISFIFGAAFMLFSENKRWWPVTFSMFALVTWVLSGWLAAWLGCWFTTRIRGL